MSAEYYVAIESVLTDVDGENVYITAGDIAQAGAPILKGREHLFEPITIKYEAPAHSARGKTTDK